MKREEQSARKFLAVRFGTEPTYEPLGKYKPPDFSIGRTAFEVRRLNQRFFRADGSNEGLEQVLIPLSRAVDSALARIRFSDEHGSFWWSLDFSRPLSGEPGDIARQLAKAARGHYAEGSRELKEIAIGDVTLELRPADKPRGKAFVMGARVDGDSGGFVGDIYPKSIRLALEEKIVKTAKVAKMFDHWGLILVDFIFAEIVTPSDLGQMDLRLEHFDSVAVITPDGSLALEWPEDSLRRCETPEQA
ncbi:MAG: hypothetical protein ABSE45_09850 [Candidatus Acidiferrales bacterium]|jgi:hypothetical protein